MNEQADKYYTIYTFIRYHELTSEVLSNVKRTEDSLLKLKRSRKSLIPETSNGISDDNKIRIQLALDIENYINQVRRHCKITLTTRALSMFT